MHTCLLFEVDNLATYVPFYRVLVYIPNTVIVIMPAQLERFSSSLQVFCPDPTTVVTSFESFLPDVNVIGKIPDIQPHLPASLCWIKQHHDYYAYLPKEYPFDGHLLSPLKHHQRCHIFKDGRWFVDDETHNV